MADGNGNGNGSWTGRDPRLRALRTAAAVVFGGLLSWAVITDGDIGTIGTLVGALLVILGFEVGLRWPGAKP